MKERMRGKSFLSASSERDLAMALGLPRLTELERRRSIELPNQMYQHTWKAVQTSERIRREIALAFRVIDGQPTKVFEKIGDPPTLDKKTGKLYSTVHTMNTLWTKMTGQLYGDPYISYFHSHTRLQESDWQRPGIDTEKIFQKYQLDGNAYLQTYNAGVGAFSHFDVHIMSANDRYFRSMLLGSYQGYRWIINPENTLVPTHIQEAARNEFQEGERALVSEQYTRLCNGSTPPPTWYTQEADILTRRFCKANGYLLFGNTDPYNPVLQNMLL